MEHRIEVSPSGRAACRTCGKSIAKGELRLGEESASSFGDGTSVRWHHLACATGALAPVLRRAIDAYEGEIPERDALVAAMEAGARKPARAATGALPSADLAPTGRAKCIHCAQAIAKDGVRIAVAREVDTGAFVGKGAGYRAVSRRSARRSSRRSRTRRSTRTSSSASGTRRSRRS